MHGMNWYEKRKQDMLNYVGDCCEHCGSESDLEFDHIDPSTKSFNVLTCYSYAWDTLTKELDKCQLLCKPCHLEKSKAYVEVHNRYRYLKHKCRCDQCKSDYSKYRRDRYRKVGV